MGSLLCNEVWFMSPAPVTVHDKVRANDKYHNVRRSNYTTSCLYSTKEDFENAIGIFLDKEASYVPKPGYASHIKSDNSIDQARFKGVCWLIESHKRLDLSFGTVFCAVSYLDRFISIIHCQGWKYWMFELLSIACLSVASKFNESITASLHVFQVEGLDHSFSSSQIQRMELTLLKALGWRMDSPTPYSYIELLIRTIDTLNKTLVDNLTARVTQLLLNTLLDSKFLEFRPCVIAMSAIKCILENDLVPSTYNTSTEHFDAFISQDRRKEVIKCQSWMEKEIMTNYSNKLESQNANYSTPARPITVLKLEWENFHACQLDLFLFKKSRININFRSSNKRTREEQECAL
ncbi:cyclin-D7-1 [Olea europaea subsp. europaea]|uniref:Cyclin-D7-1 n=1 Tax=Olea europaea subsp. europaea TaxID=158383 RepID=A0A8S0V4I4_OLEEU|nr:cyclin-D7-1 [Olea europaea subsp. europaea]CAA3025999.1 cyclin-D7-1 [Olea europaea subsp. europaea]